MENLNGKKILIVRLSAIGDVIHTLPAAFAIKKEYPEARLDWAVQDKASCFVVNNPLIDNVYVFERKKNLKHFINLIKQIRKEKYDIVIDTQQLLKSAVIMELSGGKRKISLDGGREFSFLFADEIIKTGRKQFDINYHVVKRNLEIAKYLGCKDIEPKFAIPAFEESKTVTDLISKLDKSKKTIVLAPATTWVNKHWTIDGWKKIIEEYKNKCNIILSGGKNDKKLISDILDNIEDSGNLYDISGETSLSDLVQLFKSCDVLISPDSGSAHIAWAAGCKCIITLFFATSAQRTAPFGDNYHFVAAKCPCSPCMKKHCKLKTNKNRCIELINPEEILNILKKVLS